MGKLFFDFEDGDFCLSLSDDMAMDSNGNMMMRMGDNMAMDMDSGNLHFVSSWSRDADNDNKKYFKSNRSLWDDEENF